MVSTRPITIRSRLHLLPEAVGGRLDYPAYVKVTKVGRTEVEVEVQGGGDERKWIVDKGDAISLIVTRDEVEAFAHGSLLRRAVVVQTENQYWHGQVIKTSATSVLVALAEGEVEATPDDVQLVAPVVCLLLREISFDATSWSLSEVTDVQNRVLDRVLGTNGINATRNVNNILDGIVSPTDQPSPSDLIHWIDPSDGDKRQFKLQHAVDYAYYIDGNSGTAPYNVGESFCREPARRRSATKAQARTVRYTGTTSSHPSHMAIFNHQEDDDHFLDEDERADPPTQLADATLPTLGGNKRSRDGDVNVFPSNRRARLSANDDSAQGDKEIMNRLADRPDLLRHYLNIVLQTPLPSGATLPQALAEPRSASSFGGEERATKYSFVPSGHQRRIHASITSDAHQGKHPATFVDGLINSHAVLFKPLPAVLTRVYDFQFGLRRLSLLHFQPFGDEAKVEWLAAGGTNLHNFAASVDAAPATRARSIADVVAAAQSLAVYGAEYFNSSVRSILSALVTLLQRLASFQEWAEPDLAHLVHWVNAALERYRTSIEHGVNDSTTVSQVFSLDNVQLQNLLRLVQERRLHRLQALLEPTLRTPALYGPPRDQTGTGRVMRERRIAQEVTELIPEQNGKQLCLRYLSVKGCKTSKDSGCYSGRGHFVPSQLHSRVKDLIRTRFGGLKPQFASL